MGVSSQGKSDGGSGAGCWLLCLTLYAIFIAYQAAAIDKRLKVVEQRLGVQVEAEQIQTYVDQAR